MNILILFSMNFTQAQTGNLSCYAKWGAGHNYYYLDIDAPMEPSIIEAPWDVIMINYCALSKRAASDFLEKKKRLTWVETHPALKVALTQDDYTFCHALDDWLQELGVSIVYSPIQNHLEQLYPKTVQTADFHHCYTGYLSDLSPEWLEENVKPFKKRDIDLANRINLLPPQFGFHGSIKGRLNVTFSMFARAEGFKVDVSTRPQDRIFGDNWLAFLGNSKFTVGAKGGASLRDVDGTLRQKIGQFLRKEPRASFERVEEVCFPGEDMKYVFDAVGPRFFQAVQMGCCQIMPVDDYPENIQPWVHYIPLADDLSNIDEVFECMRDDKRCEKIATNAFELICSERKYHYDSHVRNVLSVIEDKLDSIKGASDNGLSNPELIEITSPAISKMQSFLARRNYLGGALVGAAFPVMALLEKRGVLHQALKAVYVLDSDNNGPVSVEYICHKCGWKNIPHYLISQFIRIYLEVKDPVKRFILQDMLEGIQAGKLDANYFSNWRYAHFIVGGKDVLAVSEGGRDLQKLAVDKRRVRTGLRQNLKQPISLIHEPDWFELRREERQDDESYVPKRILLLADDLHPGVVEDHINAFKLHGRDRYFVWNPRSFDELPVGGLSSFDAVVIHYSLVITFPAYFPPALFEALKSYRGVVVKFMQDEYRWIDAMNKKLRDINVNILFSSLSPENISKVYNIDHFNDVDRYSCLPGYVTDKQLASKPPALTDRPFYLTGRSRGKLPFWHGLWGQQKALLGATLSKEFADAELPTDLSNKTIDRVYGDDWAKLIMSGRTIAAPAGGASLFDFTGNLQQTVDKYVQSHKDANFETISEKFLTAHEGNVQHRTITPRFLEASAFKTGIISYHDEYFGIMKPDEHYIAVDLDFGNVAEVLEKVQDDVYLERIVENSYRDIASNPKFHFKHFVAQVETAISLQAV